MLGIIVAIIMAFFRIDVTDIALFFIGLQLFDVSLNLSYFRVKDRRAESHKMELMKGLVERFGKGDSKDRNSD